MSESASNIHWRSFYSFIFPSSVGTEESAFGIVAPPRPPVAECLHLLLHVHVLLNSQGIKMIANRVTVVSILDNQYAKQTTSSDTNTQAKQHTS